MFLSSVPDPDSGAYWIRIRIEGIKKRYKMLNQHKINLLFTTYLLMITWYSYEIIIYYFQIVLKNS